MIGTVGSSQRSSGLSSIVPGFGPRSGTSGANARAYAVCTTGLVNSAPGVNGASDANRSEATASQLRIRAYSRTACRSTAARQALPRPSSRKPVTPCATAAPPTPAGLRWRYAARPSRRRPTCGAVAARAAGTAAQIRLGRRQHGPAALGIRHDQFVTPFTQYLPPGRPGAGDAVDLRMHQASVTRTMRMMGLNAGNTAI